MTKKQALQLFEQKRIRTIWDEEKEKWYFAIVDVIAVLTEQDDYLKSRKYWNKLKQRLKEEGNETRPSNNKKLGGFFFHMIFVSKKVFLKDCVSNL